MIESCNVRLLQDPRQSLRGAYPGTPPCTVRCLRSFAARPGGPPRAAYRMKRSLQSVDPGENEVRLRARSRHSDGGTTIEAANGLCLESALLSLLDHSVDGRRQTNPLRQFPFQLLPSRTRKGVELCNSSSL